MQTDEIDPNHEESSDNRLLIIGQMGTDTSHDPAAVPRRGKHDTYIVMCFLTPYFSATAGGIIAGLPGDCIVHDPGFPFEHGTLPGQHVGFRNDWVHLKGALVDQCVELFDIPLNQVIRTGNPLSLREHIRAMQRERHGAQRFWRHAVEQHARSMFLHLGRLAGQSRVSRAELERSRRRDVFVECRMAVEGDVARRWTVDEMAAWVGLSRNRFCVFYREFFDVSPVEDLIRMRISKARSLLHETDLGLEAIAGQCGFQDVYYFSRTFKARCGMPPGRYRNELRRDAPKGPA